MDTSPANIAKTALAVIGAISVGAALVKMRERSALKGELVSHMRRTGALKGDAVRAGRVAQAFDWSGQEARVLKLNGAKIPAHAAQLGETVAVVYKSRKSGEGKDYVHFFDSPRPTLAVGPDGKQLFLVGGKYRVDWSGIRG